MVKCVVIADDLTGANATGVMLRKMDYRTATILDADEINFQDLKDYECITFTTDSRALSPEEAYSRVHHVAAMCASDQIILYANRIDSTLRGNMGAETDAFLDALGEDTMAMVVPCAPASGRITVGGHMLVNGVLLNRTEAAVDPKTPVNDSLVSALFKKQSHYPIASIQMDALAKGKEFLISELKRLHTQGIRIVIFDSLVQEDIDLISDAVIESGIRFFSVDPGAFTATLTGKLVVPENHRKGERILSVVGSVNAVAKRQLEYFQLSQPVYNCLAVTKEFLTSPQDREAEITRVCEDILKNAPEYGLLSVAGDGILPEYRLDLELFSKVLQLSVDEISNIINTSMAEIAYRILKADPMIVGIYTSGGDITTAVCKKFGTNLISLESELVPLAACGRLCGGEFDGTWIVTKGGMAGNPDSMSECISKLKAMLKM